ncbi:MAG: hypothetical protein Q9174_003379 [Haloplaca sp. 1 TL-2023]
MPRCSYGSNLYKRSSSPWTSKGRLTGGTQWLSDLRRAEVALSFITLLALVGICVWSFTVQKRTNGARRLWYWFLPAVALNIVYYLWTAISIIMEEECAKVAGVYLIFDAILGSLQGLGLIILLAGIFNELVAQKSANGADTHKSGQRVMPQQKMIHLGYCGLLFLLWLVTLCLGIAITVQFHEGTGSNLDGQSEAAFRLILALSSLYLIATVYALVTSVTLLSRPQGKDKKTSIIILALVAISLLVIGIWEVAITTTRYNFAFNDELPEVNLGNLVFAGFVFGVVCIIVVFVGVVLMIKGAYPEEDNTASQDDGMVVPVIGPTPAPREVELSGPWNHESMRDHSQDPIYYGPNGGHHV